MSICVEGLTKRFAPGQPAAVEAISFTAPAGGITALLGPSGSGKTTVLRLLAGLERPDAGKVLFFGRDMTKVPARKRQVGFVFQGYALFEHMTVRKNIGFGLSIRKAPKQEIAARVEELLSLIQLEEYGDRYPSQLSGGQRQRVAFARALATKPEVLLLDEPFGALDARVRVELRDWLRALHDKVPVTTLLVTHDQDEALELATEVVLMHEGHVEQSGSPHHLYDHPATPFVASFLGSANVLKGRVSSGIAEVGSSMTVRAPEGAKDGAAVHAFVRPHEVRVVKADASTAAVSLAVVETMSRVGGFVKVELRLPSEERMTVQLAKSEADALALAVGDRVMVDLLGAKVFVEDYSI